MKRQTFFLLVVAVIITVNFSQVNNVCEKIEDSIVSAAIISDRRHTKDPNLLRDQETVSNFTREVFRNYPENIKIKYWPPIMSRSCDMEKGPETYDKGRGSNLAHKEIWDNFYRNRRKCGSKDALIIFEYDAMLGFPDAGNVAIEYAKNMTTDFLFLGYCYHKPHHHPRGGKAPYCLHAYAISVEGARKLSLLVDACGPFADAQVANLADAGLLSWSYTNHSIDKSYVNEQYQSKGIHISGTFQYDGIFLQVKLDPILMKLTEGAVVHTAKRPRLIFMLISNQWRRLPSMDMFHSLGLQQEKVLTLSSWQFMKYEEGDILTDDSIKDFTIRNSSIPKKGFNEQGHRNRTRMVVDRNRTKIGNFGNSFGTLENRNRTRVPVP